MVLKEKGGNANHADSRVNVEMYAHNVDDVVILAQVLTGKYVHDDAASHHGRHNRNMFITLKERKGSTLNGITGTTSGPMMGSFSEDGDIKTDAVLLEVGYNIDSQYQLTEKDGWTLIDNTGPRTTKYTKMCGGKLIERVYMREANETHKVRIFAMDVDGIDRQIIITKMSKIHENMGHVHKFILVEMSKYYSEDILGYTEYEAKVYLKFGDCRSCREAKVVNRRKDSKTRLIFTVTFRYGDREGLHIDVFSEGKHYWLLAQSHKFQYHWIFEVGQGYTREIIKDALELIFADYRYTGNDISFIRSDADIKFVPLKGWLTLIGLRYLVSPKGIHGSKIERGVRTERDTARTVHQSVPYKVPNKWIPSLFQEATMLINLRFRIALKKTPREAFFHEEINLEGLREHHFGEIISYQDVKNSKRLVNRLNYGAIVGRCIYTGNLTVENLATKHDDIVSLYHQKIKVDDTIITYFDRYDDVGGILYHPKQSVIIASEIIGRNIIANNHLDATAKMAEKSDDSTKNPSSPEGLCTPVCNEDRSNYDRGSNNCTLSNDVNVLDGVWKVNAEVVEDGAPRHASFPDKWKSVDEHEISINIVKILLNAQSIVNSNNCETNNTNPEFVAQCAALIEDVGNECDVDLSELDLPEYNLNIIIDALQMSFIAMSKIHEEETKAAGRLEMLTISSRGTIVGVLRRNIPRYAKVLYIMTKYTEKFKHGIFDKVKSRLLLGGDLLKNDYAERWNEINSRTVSQSSLYTLLAIMAHLGMHTGTMDFKSAFLYADLPEKDRCYAQIPKSESQLLIEIDSDKWLPFLDADGHIYVQVVGALYGHPLSAMLWYNYLKEKLALIGFKPLDCEPCVFIRNRGETFDVLAIWVDDVLFGSLDPAFIDEMRAFRKEYFNGEGTDEVGNVLEFLNLLITFDRTDRSVYISQENYWKKVCTKFELLENDVSSLPHNHSFMQRLRGREDEMELDTMNDNQKLFLALIMSILWGAKRSKPEIMFNVTALATQSKNGTKQDYDDAKMVLKYINNNKPEGIRLKVNGKIQIAMFVDSSGAIHKDMRGHGGNVITIGSEGYGGPIEINSGKAKMNGRSILEYELFSLYHGLPSCIFLRTFVEELGFKQGPILIFEDNKALIDLIKRGPISSGVTKHIAAKYYSCKDLIAQLIVELRHCPTRLMIADILTKILATKEFNMMAPRLRNDVLQHESLTDDVYKRLYLNSTDSVYHDDDDIKVIALISKIMEMMIQP